jgi:anti-sigma regulatory factor (Ser/Thr protein kinase)
MEEQALRTAVLELICPPQTDMLRLIRSVVTVVSTELGFSPEEASLIELSVDEACTNVIFHAYGEAAPPSSPEPELRVQIRPAPDRLAICVIDEGTGLCEGSPRGVSCVEEYASQQEPKGLGSYIIARFMDEVVYDSPPGAGTVLTMVKYLHKPQPPQPD